MASREQPIAPLSDSQVSALRLRAQRLTHVDTRAPGVLFAVRDLCGIQAQDSAAAALSVRVRSRGLVVTDVDDARLWERSIVRTWAMRGTLHLVPSEDLGWLLALLGPIFIAGNRSRRAELGLDDDTCARGVRVIRDAVANWGPLTKHELAEQLARKGINAEGQAIVHLVGYAALQGVVCHGPDHNGKPTYVLLGGWLPPLQPITLTRQEACAELARRYLSAYGPATPEDFAAWSGLPLKEVRAAWTSVAQDAIQVEIGGRPAWLHRERVGWLDDLRASDEAGAPIVRLLPAFDTYLLGYRSRERVVAPEHARRIHPGGGLLHPTLLVDGRAAGTWKTQRKAGRLDLLVSPFDSLAPGALPGLEAEAVDVGRFLGLEAALHIEGAE